MPEWRLKAGVSGMKDFENYECEGQMQLEDWLQQLENNPNDGPDKTNDAAAYQEGKGYESSTS